MTVTQTHNHLVCKWTLNHLAKLTSTHSSNPLLLPLQKGGWDFSKMAVMGGGNGNFLKKVSSQSWQRGDNPFYEDYLYIVYPPPPLFQILPNPPHSPSPTSLSPPGSLPCRATFDVLFYLIIIWVYTCWALLSFHQTDLDVCFMRQGIKFTEVWHITWLFTEFI